MSSEAVRLRIKQIIVEKLYLDGKTPESIGDDDILWGEGLGLDSVDALELMVALEEEYGFRIENDELDTSSLTTVAHLEAFVESMRATREDEGAPE